MKNKACSSCSGQMDMYYGAWCPRCEPPTPEVVVSINLIKCVRHLEVSGRPGIHDRVFEFLRHEIHNDITIDLPAIEQDEIDQYENGAELFEDLIAIRKLAGQEPNEPLKVEISW